VITLENQLWLWLDECDSRKPRASSDELGTRRQGGTVVAVRDREGREAEAEDVPELL